MLVDISQLGLLFVSAQGGIVFKFVARLEQFELSNRNQLAIGRRLEARQVVEFEQVFLFLRAGLAIGIEEIKHLGFAGFWQILANHQWVHRDQGRGPDDADLVKFLGQLFLDDGQVLAIVGSDINLLVGNRQRVGLVVRAA